MKPSISAKLTSLVDRLQELDRYLSDPSVVNDMDNYRKITKEHAELSPVVALFNDYQKVEADMAAAQEMAADPDMRDFADEEIKAGKLKLEALEVDLQKLLLPKDPNDDKNIFIEIRGGTGGDDAETASQATEAENETTGKQAKQFDHDSAPYFLPNGS